LHDDDHDDDDDDSNDDGHTFLHLLEREGKKKTIVLLTRRKTGLSFDPLIAPSVAMRRRAAWPAARVLLIASLAVFAAVRAEVSPLLFCLFGGGGGGGKTTENCIGGPAPAALSGALGPCRGVLCGI